MQAHFGDISGSVPDHCNKANTAMKGVTQKNFFPVNIKVMLHYTVVY